MFEVVITHATHDDIPFLVENGAFTRDFRWFGSETTSIMLDVREDKSILSMLGVLGIEYQELFQFNRDISERMFKQGYTVGCGFNCATDAPLELDIRRDHWTFSSKE